MNKRKNEQVKADPCSDDESENEVETEMPNWEPISVTDSHSGTLMSIMKL